MGKSGRVGKRQTVRGEDRKGGTKWESLEGWERGRQ